MEIDDAGDADDYLEGAYGARLRLARKEMIPATGRPVLTHKLTSVGSLAIHEVVAPGEIEATPDALDKVVVVWTTGGQLSSDCDGLAGRAEAGEVALLAQPHLPYRVASQDLAATLVLLDHDLVARAATGLPTGRAPLPVRFLSLRPVDAAAEELWKGTLSYIRDVALADDSIATPLVVDNACKLLAAVTLATFPNTAMGAVNGQARTGARPVLLERAMNYIDANAGHDITLGDIAGFVHVTPRAVQYMFRRHLDTTPLQYLRRLRLHYAHQDLVGGDRTQTTVTEIASRWGFAHTGRFAVAYRETYGQSPHTTLRT